MDGLRRRVILTAVAVIACCTIAASILIRQGQFLGAARRGDVPTVQKMLQKDPSLVHLRGGNGKTPLHMAVEGGYGPVAAALLRAGADKEAVDREGRRPLHYAAAGPGSHLLQLLLTWGVNWRARDHRSLTALHVAADAGNTDAVRHLLKVGANPLLRNYQGRTALHEVIHSSKAGFFDRLDIIDSLTASGPRALVNARDHRGWTALHYAADHGETELVNALVSRGGNINARERNGDTPLHLALRGGSSYTGESMLAHHPDLKAVNKCGTAIIHQASKLGLAGIITASIDQGEFVNARDSREATPLHYAAGACQLSGIEALIQHGADPDAVDAEGNTAMHAFVAGCSDKSRDDISDFCKELLKNNVPINKANKEGDTPLATAIKQRKAAVAEGLVQSGADTRISDRHGQSPLHLICRIAKAPGRESPPFFSITIIFLGRFGADLEARDREGRTPLHWAAENDRSLLVEALLDEGAVIEPRDNRGRTPLHLACEAGSIDTAKLLISRGADPHARDAAGRKPVEALPWKRVTAMKTVAILSVSGAALCLAWEERKKAMIKHPRRVIPYTVAGIVGAIALPFVAWRLKPDVVFMFTVPIILAMTLDAAASRYMGHMRKESPGAAKWVSVLFWVAGILFFAFPLILVYLDHPALKSIPEWVFSAMAGAFWSGARRQKKEASNQTASLEQQVYP